MALSPCINLCKMDAVSGLCQGCFRTLDEITIWSHLDESGQNDILAAVAQRRQEHKPSQGDCQR